MSLHEFLKKTLMQFFIVTTCINVGMGMLGLFLEPNVRFGYDGYFSPLIFGFISLLPSIITYSPVELTFGQTAVRKFLHLAALEALLIVFGHIAGLLRAMADKCFFALTVFMVYLMVNLFSYILDRKDAVKMNAALENLHDKEMNFENT